MAQRHKDALMISDGACNPSGIAHSLVAACKECIDSGTSQDSDPAVRLIVYQLAFLTIGEPISAKPADGTDFFDWRDACRKAEI
ncbi:MAG TPA: hypothetical protein VGR84_18700 [Candidatus Acidoferrales bacterium]|nr:hypothetical protein [Candidatus Acidoferrales bacterium]